jgi:hypothetical protein
MAKELQFTISSEPLSETEMGAFTSDLETLVLDEQALYTLNQLPRVSSSASIPKVLRAYREGQLAGVAWFIECRKPMQNILPGWFGKFMDMPGFPIFFWGRCDLAIDGFNNPGFVGREIGRDDFFNQAVDFLMQKYMNGLVINKVSDIRLSKAVTTPFVDNGYIPVNQDTWDRYLMTHQNLKRKIRKFANKGGVIEVCRGPVSSEMLAAFSRCLSDAESHAKAHLGFQDIYNPLAMEILSSIDLNLVHFVAKLDGKVVGYQSFLHSGNGLHCLSGGFDRTIHSTYHAYENIILESIRFAQENQISAINYGPIFNATKAAMMQIFQPVEMNFYTRHTWLRAGIPMLIKRSSLNPDRLKSFVNIQQNHQEKQV